MASDGKFLGVIELNDILKPGIKDRINDLHKMNIETVMLTGDDEVTAAYFAREAGIDDLLPTASRRISTTGLSWKRKGKEWWQ